MRKTRNKVTFQKEATTKKFVNENLEDYESHYEKKYGSNSGATRDFIPLSAHDDSENSEDDMMEAMALSGVADHDTGSEDFDEDDVEEEEKADEDEEDLRGTWGNRAANFYEQGMNNDDDKSDADSDADMQEEEAEKLHKEAAKSVQLSHCLLDESVTVSDLPQLNVEGVDFEKEIEVILNGLSGAVHVHSTTATPSTESLSADDLHRVLQRDHPELLPLLKEMKEKAREMVDRVQPLLQRCRNRELLTHEGLSYLEMRSQLLLCYLQYLCYYVLLKLHGRSAKDHPVLDRLVELRMLLTQLKPIESRLQPQIQRLLRDEPARSLRPRPQLLGAPSSSADQHSSLGLLDEHENSEGCLSDATSEGKQMIYKAPKVMAVEYIDSSSARQQEKQLKAEVRREQRLRKSEVVQALREEFQETPLEIEDSSSARFQADATARRLLEKERARQEFEEETMFRLPVTKTDKKERRLLREKQKLLLAGGSTLDELSSFADRAVDVHFDDPTVPLPDMTTKLTSGLSAMQGAASRIARKRKEKDNGASADGFVGAKVVKRNKYDPDVDSHFGGGEPYNATGDDIEDDHIPDVVQDAISLKENKKKLRAQQLYEKGIKSLPSLDATVEGKRRTDYKIEKNKGLVRKRKKIEGNARAHNRQKYEKRLRTMKAVQQPLREAPSSGRYEGETTGVKAHLKRSVALAA